jgi:predicted RNA-binding protein with RPS1 domain
METGQVIRCKVSGIQSYGAFVECGEIKGLIHISELSDFYVANIESMLQVGDDIDCYVLEVDTNKLKLSLKKIYYIPRHVLRHVKITTGFLTLERVLPHFIEKAKKHIKGESHDSH